MDLKNNIKIFGAFKKFKPRPQECTGTGKRQGYPSGWIASNGYHLQKIALHQSWRRAINLCFDLFSAFPFGGDTVIAQFQQRSNLVIQDGAVQQNGNPVVFIHVVSGEETFLP